MAVNIVNQKNCTEEKIHLGITTCAPKINYLRGVFIGTDNSAKILAASLVDIDTALTALRALTLHATVAKRFLFVPFSDATDNTKAPEIKTSNRGQKMGVIEYPFSAEAMYINNGIEYAKQLRKLNNLNGLVCFYLDAEFIGGKLSGSDLAPIPCDFHANLPKNGDGASNLPEHKVTLSFKSKDDFANMDGIQIGDINIEDYFDNILGVTLTATAGDNLITLDVVETANNKVNLAVTRPTAVVQTGAWIVTSDAGVNNVVTGVTIVNNQVVVTVTDAGTMSIKLAAPLVLEALAVPFGGNGAACYESNEVTGLIVT